MEKDIAIIFIGLLVFLAHAFVVFFERTKIPDVLFLILIGLIIGPILNVIRAEDFGIVGRVFSTVALVVILFEGGIEIDLSILRDSYREALTTTFLSFFIAFVFLVLLSHLMFHIPVLLSIFLAAALSGPAPAVVIPLVRQMQLQLRTQTILTLESALGEALCIVIGLAALEAFRQSNVMVGKMIGGLLSSFGFAIIIGAVSGYVWSFILNKIRELRNSIFITLSFVFIVYGVCGFLGFSGPIAVLTFGIVMGNISHIKIAFVTSRVMLKPVNHNEVEKLFFGEIVFLLKTFFFVYLGISMMIPSLIILVIALGLTIILLLARILAVGISSDTERTNRNDAEIMSIMISKGLATAVLASMPSQLGISGGMIIQQITFSVIVFSIVLTSLMLFLQGKGFTKKIFSYIYRKLPIDTVNK